MIKIIDTTGNTTTLPNETYKPQSKPLAMRGPVDTAYLLNNGYTEASLAAFCARMDAVINKLNGGEA